MAETHKEIVKVWIAPGCIVCDACETDCPEVFDVQEETCLIRPEAKDPAFTQALTPSIITAAEGCPVEVIKFDTVDVEGPAPWAGQEEEAAGAKGPAKAGGGGGGPTWSPPEGPPDPAWAGLLAHSHTSGSRSAGGPAVAVRAARATPEDIATALPQHAPPDAMDAAMIGSGLMRPRPGAAERIRQRAAALAGSAKMTRRHVSIVLAVAWGSLVATAAVAGGLLQSFMVPKVTKEPPSKFRAGKLTDFPEVGVYEQFKGSQGVWIVHLPTNELIALSDICTHLGCIPNWWPNDKKFKCPCHGSGFYMNGVNFEGPAPRPLERIKLYMEGDFVMVDKATHFRQELGQWGQPGSFLTV